ncbi:stalk domain-containing protein [Alkalihalobacillus sp. TS-13]|uniref:stalk domain-containing protein n=1 Tax=Alkalihalobacillus sp. TS-13 TaxID=2842455 RepID=UPI0021A9D780|nr:stalk domain-containing protein [Alkalihalobacillus sp. TS-13]
MPTTTNANDNIVNPIQTYTYNEMVRDIKLLAEEHPDLIEYRVIGKSEYGRDIYAVSLGTGRSTVFINGSHHAREWLTTNLNMYMIDQYAQAAKANRTIDGYKVRSILRNTTMWFVPMVNPDGVTLQQSGLSAFPSSTHAGLIKMNEGSRDFTRWKANAKGVDLNRQYDADWANIKNNRSEPSWSNHKGKAPHTASETKAIVNFTKQIDPEMVVAYHSAGKILYWNFHQTGSRYDRDHKYAKKIGYYTGYRLVYPGPNPSGGGMTDWFVSKYKRPAFTPEIGNYPGNRHLPISEFNATWQENRLVGLYTAEESYKLYYAKHKDDPVEVTVKIDGETQNFDQPAILENYRTLVPLRGVFEKLDANVYWTQSTQTVRVTKDDTEVILKIGSKTAKVNGEKVTLDVAPKLVNYRTLVPLRFVTEALGARVTWDSDTLTASIFTVQDEEPAPGDPEYVEVGDDRYRVATVIIDGEEQEYDFPAISKNYRTMIPISQSIDHFDAEISWNHEEQITTITKGDTTIELKIGSRIATVNGEEYELDAAAEVISGRTLVPLRFVSDHLGAEIADWNEETYTVKINTLQEEPQVEEASKESEEQSNSEEKAEEPENTVDPSEEDSSSKTEEQETTEENAKEEPAEETTEATEEGTTEDQSPEKQEEGTQEENNEEQSSTDSDQSSESEDHNEEKQSSNDSAPKQDTNEQETENN